MLYLQGSGNATLEYANGFAGNTVQVYLNNRVIDSAGASASKIIQFGFTDGDILMVREGVAVIQIFGLFFSF